MQDTSPLDALSALVAVLSLGLGALTLVYSRRDRREDVRLRREAEDRLADVERNERDAVSHAATAAEARRAYEAAGRERRRVEAQYEHRPHRAPLFEPRMLLAGSLGAWGVILAISNREGEDSANPANIGWGVGVAVIGVMLAVRGFQAARRAGSHGSELLWGLVVLVGTAGVVTCLAALDAYRPG